MKRLTHLICVALMAIAMGTVSCNAKTQTVTPSSNIINRTVKTGDISGIVMMCKGKVVYSQGATSSIRMNGADNVLDVVELKNNGGRLVIKFRDDVRVQSLDDDELVFYITSPSVNSLSVTGSGDIEVNSTLNVASLDLLVSGSGDVETKGIKASGHINVSVSGSGAVDMDIDNRANAINIGISGSGDVECENVTARSISCGVSGSGDVEFKGGITNKASFEVSGSGEVEAKHLEAGIVVAAVSGSGKVVCRASDTLESSISGSGSIKYYGTPKVTSAGRKQPEAARF